MNRFRVGLHVPGNVVLSCKRCNSEKRRDDTLETLSLAQSGWESFLAHDGTKCPLNCKTCSYWKSLWPNESSRLEHLRQSKGRIVTFMDRYPAARGWSSRAQATLRPRLGTLYRQCQEFATTQIQEIADTTFSELRSRPLTKVTASH